MLDLANDCRGNDTKSLATHPASTTHSQLSEAEYAAAGISAEMVRISVGIEDITDIIADVEQALTQSQSAWSPALSHLTRA